MIFWSTLKLRPHQRQFYVAVLAAEVVRNLTKYNEHEALELAMLKGGTPKILSAYCDLESAVDRAMDEVFEDEELPYPGDEPAFDNLRVSVTNVALGMLKDVFGDALHFAEAMPC